MSIGKLEEVLPSIANRLRIADLESQLAESQKECERLRVALNPQLWTGEVSALWHTSIPDTVLAFYELRKWAALKRDDE